MARPTWIFRPAEPGMDRRIQSGQFRRVVDIVQRTAWVGRADSGQIVTRTGLRYATQYSRLFYDAFGASQGIVDPRFETAV